MFVNIDDLKFSQIYLSKKKIDDILKWFKPSLENFNPVPFRDFLGNGDLTLTDGHTRTYVAWLNGLKKIPAVYDNDEIVTCELGHELYVTDTIWCKRFNINHVSDFSNRILNQEEYELLWNNRCRFLQNLVKTLESGIINREDFKNKEQKLLNKGLYVYGISSDYSILYCEDLHGKQFNVDF